MSKSIYIFDIDGTIAESGKPVDLEMLGLLGRLKTQTGCELGLCGGGTFEKARNQVLNTVLFDHIFAECGCDYRKYNTSTNEYKLVQEKNIRFHKLLKEINVLIKYCLKFISEMEYSLGGHMIDVRKGIVYVSLVGKSYLDLDMQPSASGMTATEKEREEFIALDQTNGYRFQLIEQLNRLIKVLGCENHIQVMIGGQVGITIMPIAHDKVQILNYLDSSVYKLIGYFGDKYEVGGNDYRIMKNLRVQAHKVSNPEETKKLILNILELNKVV
jgi:phosphomannomutase